MSKKNKMIDFDVLVSFKHYTDIDVKYRIVIEFDTKGRDIDKAIDRLVHSDKFQTMWNYYLGVSQILYRVRGDTGEYLKYRGKT